MSKEDLVNTARAIFAKAGFDVSSSIGQRSICFNFAARRKDVLLIVKVLGNIDAFARANADDLKTIQDALGGNPLLIGTGTGSGPLEDGIVYTRFKIPIISAQTLAEHLLEEVPPYIFAAPGGLYVRLNGERLGNIRTERGISLGTLADVAGVSRRTIQMYETGMGAMIDAALRLEEFLGTQIVEPVDPFTYGEADRNSGMTDIQAKTLTAGTSLDRLVTIGYAVTPIVKGPFDAVSRDDRHGVIVLTGVDSRDTKLVDRAIAASELSSMSERPAVIIVSKKPRDSIEGTALVSDDELRRIDDPSVLNDLIFSRSGRR